jgi:hypothetical protein
MSAALVRFLGEKYPVGQIVFYRSASPSCRWF